MSLAPEFDGMIGMMVAYHPKIGVPCDRDYELYLGDVHDSKDMKDELSGAQTIVLVGSVLGMLACPSAVVYIGGKLSRLW